MTKEAPTMSNQSLVGKKAPFFSGTAVVNGDFKKVSLDDYKGKYLILFAWPLDYTFVCPTEIIAFSEKADAFRAAGAEVVGFSVDSEYTHLAWTNTPRKQGGLGPMKIPLLADITKQISRDYGILLDESVALRGTFIIDKEQKVRIAMVNDLPIGRNVDEVLRLLEAVKFTDEHGDQVCPASWTKGSLTMNPDPSKAKAYFEKVNA